MNSSEHVGTQRESYYRDYWRAPELSTSEHLRWKIDLTRRHPAVLAARSVLDVGCGSGSVLAALRSPSHRLAGVEMSADAARSLQALGIEGYAVDLESDRLPFKDADFEVVLCYDVLEHVFSPSRLLGEIRRVLRPDGLALLCVPNTLNLFNRLVFLTGEYVDVMDTSHRSEELFSNHIRLFSKGLFERFLAANKFDVLERHYYFPARFSDARFKLPSWLARAVTAPQLHKRFPAALALGFLYACRPRAA
ncbi:MAG TPA: class I SAM-dependent methyltransferase [Polyangiaceae bacterium]|jgi:SAM-dependent methyltransferase|nr:class I SAM-dependent methyltransferase [Polyangiaceae bacterium]